MKESIVCTGMAICNFPSRLPIRLTSLLFLSLSVRDLAFWPALLPAAFAMAFRIAEDAACVENGLLPVMSCSILDDLPAKFSVSFPTPVRTELPAALDMLRVAWVAASVTSPWDLVSMNASSLDAKNADMHTPDETSDAACKSGLPSRILVPVASKMANTSLDVHTTVFCSAT